MKRRPRRACRRCRLAESVTNGGGARAEDSRRLGFLFGGIWLCFQQRRSNEGASRRRLRFVGPMTGTTVLDQATARVPVEGSLILGRGDKRKMKGNKRG
ncbi:hypothetical protein V6N11_025771 [Hibiscus sabdariffa]|uniref:Uncharacterized protein n=1 Tax=Hibiscus sabdariffa TaxID=183260 RepID=A0ABR2STL7_9ROSI